MNKLLFQLDTDAIANAFDTVVGFDGGADHVIPKSGITPENVGAMVDGAIFTRSPKNNKNTALFVTGSSMRAGEAVMAAVKKHFFSDFRVSVMLDSNGRQHHSRRSSRTDRDARLPARQKGRYPRRNRSGGTARAGS